MTSSSSIQPLSWDSEFLGFPVASLVVAGLSAAAITAAIADARKAGYRLLYAVSTPFAVEEAEALCQGGAWLASQKMTYVISLNLPTTTLLNPAVTDAAIYTPQLESLALQSGEYSRFRLDKRFPPSVFKRLYSRWLHNSLSGAIARRVLVWRTLNGQEVGLLTLGEKNGRADIGLLAVDAAVRGQRIGQQLITAAQIQAVAWGYTSMQVVTQGSNSSACHFYEKCGFHLDSVEHVYHLWLN
jgi:dTDP-4-amino-4,6-dideoxy-D-galactose acyltransferase